jgi:diguanylate cyclase (GGDEF)-like protein
MGTSPASEGTASPAPDPNRVLWRRFVLAQALAITAFFFVPHGGWLHVLWQVAIGWTSAAFVVVGVRRHRPASALAWYLLGFGVLMNATGTLVEGIETNALLVDVYPSAADLFWAGLYPAFIAGMVLLIRPPGGRRGWTMLVETGTIITGLGLLAWVLVIRPQAFDPLLTMTGRAATIVYPVSDLVLLAMTVRLLLGGGHSSIAFRLVLASLLALLISDVGWTVFSLRGLAPGPTAHHLLAMIFDVAYALIGAAALHPSIRGAAVATPAGREQRLSPALLAGLTIASLVAPALLITQALQRQIVDGLAIGVGSTVLFLLVLTRMAQLLRQIEAQALQLRGLARVDELTRLPNRRAWSSELPLAIERARRDGLPVSVAMIDLDYFKRFNDTFGHPAGDRLLEGAALHWRERLREVDQLARYGGEEFVALLPSADTEQALSIVERLRAVTPGGQTFSAGIATWNGVETGDELVARADRALYQAKASGRNRCLGSSELLVDQPRALATGGRPEG